MPKSLEIESVVRPNHNYEMLVDLSARLQNAWESAQGQQKDELGHLLDYINGKYFETVENTDFPPEGELSVDDLSVQGERLMGDLNEK